MYSSEIDDILKKRNYCLPSHLYFKIVDNSSQIEGFYLLEMVGDETFEITLIRNLVRFNGKEYEAGDKEAFNTIYDTIREAE